MLLGLVKVSSSVGCEVVETSVVAIIVRGKWPRSAGNTACNSPAG